MELLTERTETVRARVTTLEAQLARWANAGCPCCSQTEAEAPLASMCSDVQELEQWCSTAEKVSKNGFIAPGTRTHPGVCPDPLRLFAYKQWWSDEPDAQSALATTPSLTVNAWSAWSPTATRRWKLGSNRAKVSSPATISFRRQLLSNSILATTGMKELGAIGSKSRACVAFVDCGLTLTFLAPGLWQGIAIVLRALFSYQLPLPGFDPYPEVQP